MKFTRVIAVLMFVLSAKYAQAQTEALPVYSCGNPGVRAIVSGLTSSNYLLGIIPSCQVRVYLTGTTTLATIYKDSSNTPQTNPFTALYNGSVQPTYAATNECYDVQLSGGIPPNTYATPVTLTGVCVGGGGGGGGSTAFSAITSGTNTTASMIVGSGSSLYFSGSGIINANQWNGSFLGAPWYCAGAQCLGGQANTQYTTLNLLTPSMPVGPGDTVINFSSTAGFPSSGKASWQDSGGEVFSWSTNDGTTLGGVVRGLNGTTPASHDTSHAIAGWVYSMEYSQTEPPAYVVYNNGWVNTGGTEPISPDHHTDSIFAQNGLNSPYAPIFSEELDVSAGQDSVHGVCNPLFQAVTNGTTAWFNGVSGTGCSLTQTASIIASTGAATFSSLFLPGRTIGNCLTVGVSYQVLDQPCSGGGGGGNTTSTSLTPTHLPQAVGSNSIIDSSLIEGGSGTGMSTPEKMTASAFATSGAANGFSDITYTGVLPASPSANTVGYTQAVAVSSPYRISPAGAGFTGLVKRTLTSGIDYESMAVSGTDYDPGGAAAAIRFFSSPAMFNVDYYQANFSTLCTGYTYATDCAAAAAINYNAVTSGHPSVALQFGVGTYLHSSQIVQPQNANSLSLLGSGHGDTILQAAASMGPQVAHTAGSTSALYVRIVDIQFNANNLAQGCIQEYNIVVSEIGNISCQNVNTSAGNGTSNVGIDIGGRTSATADDNMLVYNLNYLSTTGHAGNAVDILATVSGGVITGFQVGQQASGCSVSAAGSGGTPGTYTWTSTGGGFLNQPSGSYVIGSGGTITSCSVGYYGYMGTGSPTAVLASGTGLTGGSLNIPTNTGATLYNTNAPVTIVYLGHSLGVSPCTTMPAVNTSGTQQGILVKPPTVTYDGSGRITALTLQDSTVTSTGSGCVGPIRAYAYSTDQLLDAIVLNYPDSHTYFVNSTAGFDAGILVAGGGSRFYNMHPYDGPRYGIKNTGGNNVFDGLEFDSISDAGFYVANSLQTISHSTVTYDLKSNYAGAAEYLFGASAGSYQKIEGGHTDSIPQDAADYCKYVTSTGCFASGGGVLPKGIFEDFAGNGEPNGAFTQNYVGIPVTGPLAGGIQFMPPIASNSTTVSRNLNISLGGFKYINSSTPSGYYPWIMEAVTGVNSNQIVFLAPGNDPQLQTNTNSPAVVFGTNQLPTVSQNFNSPVFGFKGNGCFSISGSTCTGFSPQVGFQEVLNPSTVGGAVTSIAVAWNHSSGIYPYYMTMPYNLQPDGIVTPGVAVQPLAPPTITVTSTTTGGTLTAGTYCYSATSVSVYGESLPSAQACTTTTGSTSTVSVFQSAVVPNANYYNVYGRTSGSQLLMTANGVTQNTTTLLVDTGSVTPSGTAPTFDASMAPTSQQPVTSAPFIAPEGSTTSIGGTGQTIFSTGSTVAQFDIRGSVACDSAVSGASVVLTVKYSDPSNTLQTMTGTANCTTLGPASVAGIDQVVRVNNGTTIKAYTTVTGTPVYGASVVVVQDTTR